MKKKFILLSPWLLKSPETVAIVSFSTVDEKPWSSQTLRP